VKLVGVPHYDHTTVEQAKANAAAARLTTKPTSQQLRRESAELREFAVKLMEHASTLVARAVELEKKVALLNQGRKP
jgi:hypothetical protein